MNPHRDSEFFLVIYRAAATVFTVLLLAGSPTMALGAPESVAAAMVSKLRLGSNLEPMALRVALNTETYRGLAARLSVPRAKQLVASSVRKAVPAYQTAWDASLSRAYAELLSTEEMASLIEKGQASPYFTKFSSSAGAVGARMQASSLTLLQQVVTAALSDAMTAANS